MTLPLAPSVCGWEMQPKDAESSIPLWLSFLLSLLASTSKAAVLQVLR